MPLFLAYYVLQENSKKPPSDPKGDQQAKGGSTTMKNTLAGERDAGAAMSPHRRTKTPKAQPRAAAIKL